MAKKATGAQKLYRNAGITELVFEDTPIEPGAEFRATLTPEHEMQLLQGGHLEILEDQSTAADQAQAAAAETGEGLASSSIESTEPGNRRRRS